MYKRQVLIGGAAVYELGLLGKQLSVENALRDAVMAALGLAVSGFFLRREVVHSRLDYDNGEHLMRFWTAVWCSLLFSDVYKRQPWKPSTVLMVMRCR